MEAVAKDFGIQSALDALGILPVNDGGSTGSEWMSNGELIKSHSPVDGQLIGSVKSTTKEDYDKIMGSALTAFKTWRVMPAPQRGEICLLYTSPSPRDA